MNVQGTFVVNAPLAEAFELFTPLGEQRWVAGWTPRFCVPTADDTAPGTVFITTGHGVETVWVVAHRAAPREMVYARTSPDRAGTVRVRCADCGDSRTEVSVEYVLTARNESGEKALAAFAERYGAFLEGWRDDIEAALTREHREHREHVDI